MKKISLILFVVFMCCKNETKDAVTIEEANTVLTENLEEENKYKIELNGVFTTNSTLVLNYLSKVEERFTNSKKITKQVNGSLEPQTVIFELPKNDDLEKFRIKPILKEEQLSFQLDSISISINNNKINILPNEYKMYLRNNVYSKIDNETGVITLITQEVKGKTVLNPFILSTPKLSEAIFNL